MKNVIFLSFIILLLGSLNSCSYRKQRYLKDIAAMKPDTISIAAPPNYKIKVNDILSVRVFSYSKDVNELFNSFQGVGAVASSTYNIEANAFYSGYNVSDSGYIKVPVIGDIYVKDKTIEEIKIIVGEKLNNYVQDAIVFVKLILFKVIILGEVNAPGLKYVYSNRISVLEAMALAGDVRDMGDRRNVLIVRSTDKGVLTYRVDLTDPKIIASNSFYILPNDVIYVEPRKAKALQLDWATISIFVSALTTLMLVFSYIKLVR